MSYDIYFIRRQPGQSWEAAMEEASEGESAGDAADDAAGTAEVPDPEVWNAVVAEARELLGEISTFGSPPACELDHKPTGLQLSCFSGQWSLTLPYWSEGDNTTEFMTKVHALTEAVERLTGLEAYDPQLGAAVAEANEPGTPADDDAFDISRLFADADGPSA